MDGSVTIRELLGTIAALLLLGWVQTWVTCWIGMALVRRNGRSPRRRRAELRELAAEIDDIRSEEEEADDSPANAGEILP